jgi:cytochrome c oxidase subunit 1
MVVFTLAMMGAGTLGVERRHWDMAFTDSALAFDYPASAFTFMGVVGISGVAAILGGAIFVLITVISVFFGKRVGSESSYGFSTSVLRKAEPDIVPAGGHAAAGRWGFAAPGTLLLAFFFLLIFVLYYAVNWKYLASVWPMS